MLEIFGNGVSRKDGGGDVHWIRQVVRDPVIIQINQSQNRELDSLRELIPARAI